MTPQTVVQRVYRSVLIAVAAALQWSPIMNLE